MTTTLLGEATWAETGPPAAPATEVHGSMGAYFGAPKKPNMGTSSHGWYTASMGFIYLYIYIHITTLIEQYSHRTILS